MTNDITSELAKLHELTGVEFSRQVERIAKRKEFHPLETDKDIFTTGGEQSDDYENLLQTAQKKCFFCNNPCGFQIIFVSLQAVKDLLI